MYGDDVRAFADALYLDHGHTYEDIAFLLADSRKFATQTHQRVMPAASAGDCALLEQLRAVARDSAELASGCRARPAAARLQLMLRA